MTRINKMHKEIIRSIPLFSTLPPAELDALENSLVERSYPMDTVLFREGEHGDRFYIVVDGQVAILKAMDTENERSLGILGSGKFIGEMSLLNPDGLRVASVRVHSNARLLEMTRADFDALLNRVPTIAYEMLRVLSRRLKVTNDNTIHDLMEKNRKLAEAYAELKEAQAQIIEKEIMERDLAQAREIQESMLPSVLPQLEGFDIGATMVPARMVGGDFYDVIPLGSDRLAIVIGDVSGKGVPAALFMALTRSLLRAEAKPDVSPAKVLLRVNQLLLTMNEKNMFVTILYGVLDAKTGEFYYVRAGHEPLMLWDKDGKLISPEFGHGQIIAILPDPTLESQTITLPPGATLLLYTDGVTETTDRNGDFFDYKGIEMSVPQYLSETAQGLCDSMVHALGVHQDGGSQFDDITLLAVKVDQSQRQPVPILL
jgi:sigma-B regulation protein RsbU (phosphoserine phosphatase)